MMTAFLVGCAALHCAPAPTLVRQPAVARRAAVLVMDEEPDVSFAPVDVSSAAADVKDMLKKQVDLVALSREANELDAALLHGYDAEKVQRLAEVEAILAEAASAAQAAAAPTSAQPLVSADLQALVDEKQTLDEALSWGYDADKLKRLGEVEAALAAADCALPEAELTPEEAAKADWMRRTYDSY